MADGRGGCDRRCHDAGARREVGVGACRSRADGAPSRRRRPAAQSRTGARPISASCRRPKAARLTGRRCYPPAASASCLRSFELISVVGANPCARSKWRIARRVAVLGAGGLDRVSKLRKRDLRSAPELDPSGDLSCKKALIWSGANTAELRTISGAKDLCWLSCPAGSIEDVMSGADAWSARKSPAVGRPADEVGPV